MLHARNASEIAVARAGLQHRVYIPEDKAGPRPTVVLVHGRAGSSRVMWLFSKALEGCKPLVVSPEATVVDPIGGFSWWQLFHNAEEESPLPKKTSKEDLAAPLIALERFIEAMPELYGGDLNQLYGFGFSQGAALLASLSIQRPTLFRGVAMLSGFLPGIMHQQLQEQPPQASLPSYFIAHGRKDEIIPFARAEQARDALQAVGARTSFHVDEVGHKVGSAGIRALRSWIEGLLD